MVSYLNWSSKLPDQLQTAWISCGTIFPLKVGQYAKQNKSLPLVFGLFSPLISIHIDNDADEIASASNPNQPPNVFMQAKRNKRISNEKKTLLLKTIGEMVYQKRKEQNKGILLLSYEYDLSSSSLDMLEKGLRDPQITTL